MFVGRVYQWVRVAAERGREFRGEGNNLSLHMRLSALSRLIDGRAMRITTRWLFQNKNNIKKLGVEMEGDAGRGAGARDFSISKADWGLLSYCKRRR